jgi:hypothetical protein
MNIGTRFMGATEPTDAVMNDLPPHIAQVISGHWDINVTMSYKATYPDEAIEAHREFIARRRITRSSGEYRLDDLEVICEVLGCEPGDLLVREPGKIRLSTQAWLSGRAPRPGAWPGCADGHRARFP